MAESKSVFSCCGRISTVFIVEILYPTWRKGQPSRQLFDEPHLFGVHLRRRVRRLHHRRNPGQPHEKLRPRFLRNMALPDPLVPVPVASEPVPGVVQVQEREEVPPRSPATARAPSGVERSCPATCACAVSTQTRTPAFSATSARASNLEQSCVPAPTEFSIRGSAGFAASVSAAANSRARIKPSTSRSAPSFSPLPAWLPEWTTTKWAPREPAATSSAASARAERSRCSGSGEARLKRYFACAITGLSSISRASSAKALASERSVGTAQPWGLETKIWTVSKPCSRGGRKGFLRPPGGG